MVPSQDFRIYEAKLAGGEIAGETGESAGEGESAELVREHRKADGTHALFVYPDAGEGAAERGVQYFI